MAGAMPSEVLLEEDWVELAPPELLRLVVSLVTVVVVFVEAALVLAGLLLVSLVIGAVLVLALVDGAGVVVWTMEPMTLV